MTNEEAIAKMEQQKNAFLDKYADYGGVTEAYNMAISAIEAQVPCEDVVSRAVIMQHYDSEEYKHVNHISRNNLLDYIEQMPSVTPKPCEDAVSRAYKRGRMEVLQECDDIVSRKAVLNLLYDILDRVDQVATVDHGIYIVARNSVDALPSVTPKPERKKGKWVRYDGDWFKTMYKCSECGAMIDFDEKSRNFFCYHCGARMEGEQDE